LEKETGLKSDFFVYLVVPIVVDIQILNPAGYSVSGLNGYPISSFFVCRIWYLAKLVLYPVHS
jgi:hypothetical protein